MTILENVEGKVDETIQKMADDNPDMTDKERTAFEKWKQTGSVSRVATWNAALQAACEAECKGCRESMPYIGNGWHQTILCKAWRIRALMTKPEAQCD